MTELDMIDMRKLGGALNRYYSTGKLPKELKQVNVSILQSCYYSMERGEKPDTREQEIKAAVLAIQKFLDGKEETA